jgi:hypothetical protein
LINKQIFKYDESQNLIETRFYNFKNSKQIFDKVIYYKYDENNNKIESNETTGKSEKFIYDDDNNVVKSFTQFKKNGNVLLSENFEEIIYKYELYDKEGNWTKKTTTIKGIEYINQRIIKRDIAAEKKADESI